MKAPAVGCRLRLFDRDGTELRRCSSRCIWTLGLTGVIAGVMMTHMVKTQVYLPEKDLKALHKLAKAKRRKVADLVREAVQVIWLRETPKGPVGLWEGPFVGSSIDHDSAFDDAQ